MQSPLRGRWIAAMALVGALVTSGLAQEPRPAQQPDFGAWLEGVRAEAVQRGISAATIDRAFTGLEIEPVVVARDRAQPEQVQSLDAYLKQRLSRRTLASANAMHDKYQAVLTRVEARYGVPRETLVAIWGIESNFGQFTGSRPVITALATLAFDTRRPTLFRAELFHALTILDQGHITIKELKGSWAGAMGQPQFMPSSYLKHAVDFDEDGRADIWNTQPDVFASIANYLKNAGWTKGERWGREVRVNRAALDRIERQVPMRSSGCRAVKEMTQARPLSQWAKLGVLQANGRPLPTAAMDASLVRGMKQHFLVYRNYHALIDYNCSNSYAISAGVLSDQVR
ncbi:MAG: lytic murein transglycosylase [Acidobacteria bacterium]|nr:lytic murein transglycosylase [Acidobacteriota bacterium]